ncbi:MAG: glycogen debranching N-terminal domain-containing protein [Stackebrandtia sp.]
MTISSSRQLRLHDRVICLALPALWTSAADGQLGDGPDGVYVADRRVLSRLRVRVDGASPDHIVGGRVSARRARFVGVVRDHGDDSPDPTVTCERDRLARPDGGAERILVRNRSRGLMVAELSVEVAADMAGIGDVRASRRLAASPPRLDGSDLMWTSESGDLEVRLGVNPKPIWDDRRGVLCWAIRLEPGDSFTASLDLVAETKQIETGAVDTAPGFRPLCPAKAPPWRDEPLAVRAADRRLDELVRQGVDDLGALLLSDSADVDDLYCAAGAPWFVTLFGRDSLWAARMSLPLGAELAAGTLRALARRQGVSDDPKTQEAPGKIPHELRPPGADIGLPEVYYGAVDATPLFVVALAEAWRWGMDEAQVAALLPAAERALDWLVGAGDPDGDGFVEYAADDDGLSNQGWKDSHDGVQWTDGRLAEPPLALCEVQAYAFQAAVTGADLLDAFGRPGGRRWRDWADGLATRFRESFWVSDEDGPYPAIALDRDKQPVDSPTSNIGHLLGTGLLDSEEEEILARRLSLLSLDSGYGLRTLADTARGFNPLSYHAGSVWPHDTAIAIWGLARGAARQSASRLIDGLLAAAPHFGYRLPELYGGQRRSGALPPTPYPAACHPQAWAAGCASLIVRALLGLEVDAPAGRIRLRPLTPSPVGSFAVDRLRVAGGELSVHVDADGRLADVRAPKGIAVDVP